MSLTKIQSELKAPKNQYNSFGKYKYRSCEDILEAVKPLLTKYNATLTLSDEAVAVGNRIYIKAVAMFAADGVEATVTAFAREAETKKGMDDSQITGTASSYARKYALNGLFLIDDTKDADTDEHGGKTEKPNIGELQSKIVALGISIEEFCKQSNIRSLADIPAEKYEAALRFAASMVADK